MVVHTPVLLEESITALHIEANDSIVDGTFGGGGHSMAIFERYGSTVRLVCTDLDETAQERFDSMFRATSVQFIPANFKDAAYILSKAGLAQTDKVLLDLGTSTFQLLDDTAGFSFHSDAPLMMTFSKEGSHTGFTASDIVNHWDAESIADIIYAYGEDRHARKIARTIVEARLEDTITTAKQLAHIIERAVPRHGRLHPATKTFQALRIAVNDELAVIEAALTNWWEVLKPKGRIVVITFHSLEDRVVKQWMKKQLGATIHSKKPLVPSKQELLINPRSRSAKLRIIEK